MKFKVGDRVVHFGHGPGTVVRLNTTPKNNYFEEKPVDVLKTAAGNSALLKGLVDSLYDGERYPYVVKFDKGYQDVYSENDLTGAVDNGDGTGSFKGKLVGMGF
jgi:hypothetical protein